MGYTSEQQGRIDSANAKIATAQTDYDNAIKSKDELYSTLQTIFSRSELLSDCYKDPQSSLDAQLAWGTLNSGNCKKKLIGDGLKCPKCLTSVAEYNGRYNNYKSAETDVSSKLSVLNNAKEELKNLLDSIAGEVQNDPDFILNQTQIEQDAKSNNTKWILFGLALLMTIGGGIVIGWRTEIKKIYIILTGVGMSILFYVLFFGIGKKK